MQTITEKLLDLAPPGGVFDETSIRNLFPQRSAAARKLLLHRAVEIGEVLRLKSGLYCLAKPYRKTHLHPFALAGMLHSPSHVSLESALSYHGLLPEAVFGVASVTSKRSRSYTNPLGVFSFLRIPTNMPRAGVQSIKLDHLSWAFIASPLRAIADLIYLRKGVTWHQDGMGFLMKSMRMEEEDLRQMSLGDHEEIRRSMRNKRVRAYLRGLHEELRT